MGQQVRARHTGGAVDQPDTSGVSSDHAEGGSRASVVPVFQQLSTRSVPVGSQFASRIEPSVRPGRGGFHGEMIGTTPWHGVVFADLRGDPITCRFGDRGSNVVLLGWVRDGVVNIHHGRDVVTPVNSRSGLVLFDCDRPFVTTAPKYAMTYLALPRAEVVAALGQEPVAGREAVRVLRPGHLVTGFLAQLGRMVVEGASGPRADAGGAVYTARALALALLARTSPHWRSLPDQFDAALLVAARYLLTQHAGDAKLTACRLAAMLGCSRAHLYRLFERAGGSIACELREVRLQRARGLLRAEPGEPIGAIGWRCGYSDFSAFGKAFHRRFGMAPGDCRHTARG